MIQNAYSSPKFKGEIFLVICLKLSITRSSMLIRFYDIKFELMITVIKKDTVKR